MYTFRALDLTIERGLFYSILKPLHAFLILWVNFIEEFIVSWMPFFVIICFTFVVGIIASLFLKEETELSHKHDKWVVDAIVGASIVVGTFVSLTISAKGYDAPYFMYLVGCIKERGLMFILETDRPLYYLVTYGIGEILHVSSRIAVSLSGVVGAVLYMVSIFLLVNTIFDNNYLASLSSLIVAGMYLTRQLVICFIGNVFGVSMMMLYLVAMWKYLKYRSWKWIGLSTIILISVGYSHVFSAIYIVIVMGAFCVWSLLRDDYVKYSGPFLLTIAHIAVVCLIILSLPENRISVQSLISFMSLSSLSFFYAMRVQWSSEYVWVLILTVFGLFFMVQDRRRDANRLVLAWVAVTLFLTVVAGILSGRVMVFFPYHVLSAYCIVYVMSRIGQRRIVRYGEVILVVFLIMTPGLYYACITSPMMARYFDRGPFAWDMYNAEEKQLVWIAENYNIEEIVVLTDTKWGQPWVYDLDKTHPHLRIGIHFRLLGEIGNNIYVGHLVDLIKDNYTNYGWMDTEEAGPFVGYLDRSVPKDLRSKTIIVPSTVYNIDQIETEILIETSMDGIFILKNMSREEELDWVSRYERNGGGV